MAAERRHVEGVVRAEEDVEVALVGRVRVEDVSAVAKVAWIVSPEIRLM